MIPNYWWRTHKVLPTTYDESLSYYEVLNKITYYINQIIQSIEQFEKTTTQQVADISELVTNIRNDVDKLNTRCSALEVLTGQHTTQISTNTTDITSLKTRTTTLENRTTTQAGEISTNTGDITSLKTRTTNLENKTTTQAGEISTLGQQISDIDVRVDKLEAKDYISINCADLSEITFSGSVDYAQVAVYINNDIAYFYQFGTSRSKIRPFNCIVKSGDNAKIIITSVGAGGSEVTLSKTLRINVDGVSKLSLPSIPWNGTSNTYTLNLNDTDFNSELSFHNIDIGA